MNLKLKPQLLRIITIHVLGRPATCARLKDTGTKCKKLGSVILEAVGLILLALLTFAIATMVFSL